MSIGRALISDRALQKRVVLTLGILAVIYVVSRRLLPTIPESFVRGLRQSGYLEASRSGMSIGALGLMPYLAASLWIQLATPLIPVFRRWRDQGQGRRLLIMQVVAMLVLCFFQGRLLLSAFGAAGPNSVAVLSRVDGFLSIFMLAGGSVLFLVGGLLINRHGIGNGIALVVAMLVAVQLPNAVETMVGMAFPGSGVPGSFSVFQVLAVSLCIVMVFAAAVAVYTAEAKVPVTYGGGTEDSAKRTGHLRLPLFFGGYMPIVFMQAFLMVLNPACLWLFGFGIEQIEFGKPGYSIAMVILLMVYGLFWGRVGFSPRRLALYLAEDGGRIEGCEPGRETARFLRRKLDRLNVAGTLALVGFALLPMVMNARFDVPFSVAQFMGGTSVLVLAAVGVDLYRHLAMHARSGETESPAV